MVEEATDLRLPEGERYECLRCGMSCRMFHEVPVDGPTAARWRELGGVAGLMRPEGRGMEPSHPSPVTPEREILSREGGACVFLHPGNSCALHAEHGADAKPRPCRDFPFHFVEAGGAVYTGLSFACSAVLKHHGPLLTGEPENAAAAAASSGNRASISGPILLQRGQELPWDVYMELEADLDAALAAPGAPVGVGLLAQAVYLDLLAALMQQSGTSAAEALGALRRKYPPGEVQGPLFQMARRLRGVGAVQRAFAGQIVTYRGSLEAGDRPAGRWRVLSRLVRHHAAHTLRLGRIRLPGGHGVMRYRDFRQLAFDRWEPASPEGVLLRRYFRHSIFRKDLLAGSSVLRSHRLLLARHALVRWYAVGTAAAGEAGAIELEHLQEAIRSVERLYGVHSPLDAFLERVAPLGMVLDSLLRKPNFPPSMIGPPV